ncbi:MAG: NADH-quinone oxidoreductase subunit M [Betaproteobacteria bacterium]|nr:NADH-quinone oxidoreductase subunit M [Betaproteobacteria bacterium]
MKNVLSILIFLPLAGSVLLGFMRGHDRLMRWSALGVTVATFLVSVAVLLAFNPATHEMQFVERYPWAPSFNIEYAVGVDGISILLVLLTTLLCPICVLASWTAITSRAQEFMIAILVMEAAMIGTFVALDFVLFFVFWEAMLIPMYLIIGVWGGPNRIYSAIKFFLYTLAGSLLLLVAIIVLYFAGGNTFDILTLMGRSYSATVQFWVFWAFFLAFAIKIPMIPFHTWLPDAHVEAPAAGSIILAGILLKMGGYGFLRFCLPMVPDASLAFSTIIMTLSVGAILYGAFMALAQTDVKKLIAYSSVSHMGFVTLGIFVLNTRGVEGALLQMVNHGITTGALFLAIGQFYDRSHSRLLEDFGGISKPMPMYGALWVIFSFSSFGFPGTNSFIGEFLVLVGSFERHWLLATAATLGLILSAFYMLWVVRKALFGTVVKSLSGSLPDLNVRELVAAIPLAVLVFVIGLYPRPWLSVMHASVEHLLMQVGAATPLQFTEVWTRP